MSSAPKAPGYKLSKDNASTDGLASLTFNPAKGGEEYVPHPSPKSEPGNLKTPRIEDWASEVAYESLFDSGSSSTVLPPPPSNHPAILVTGDGPLPKEDMTEGQSDAGSVHSEHGEVDVTDEEMAAFRQNMAGASATTLLPMNEPNLARQAQAPKLRLVYMPPMYNAIKEIRGVKYATRGSVMQRPGLFFDVTDLTPRNLKAFESKHWLTPNMTKILLPHTSDEADAHPFAIDSDIPKKEAIKYEGVYFKQDAPKAIRHEKAIALTMYRIAALQERVRSLPASALNAQQAHFNRIYSFVPRVSAYNALIAEASANYLGKVTSCVRKGKDLAVQQMLWQTYLMAICMSRRRNVSMETYKKATEKARVKYFGAEADYMWHLYTKSESDKSVLKRGKNLVASGLNKILSFAQRKPKTAADAVKKGIAGPGKPAQPNPPSFIKRMKEKLTNTFIPIYSRLGKDKYDDAYRIFNETYSYSTKFFGKAEPSHKWYHWFTNPATITHSKWANTWCRLFYWTFPDDLTIENATYKDAFKIGVFPMLLALTVIPSAEVGIAYGLFNFLTGGWAGAPSVDSEGLC
jgi:hypothetical protein